MNGQAATKAFKDAGVNTFKHLFEHDLNTRRRYLKVVSDLMEGLRPRLPSLFALPIMEVKADGQIPERLPHFIASLKHPASYGEPGQPSPPHRLHDEVT
jgi:hypothetical protein